MSGVFITFEGGEGGGKTTQIKRLAAWLEGQGRSVIVTREPGGTAEADKIRKLLVEREGGDWSPLAECLLLFAGRVMHWKDKIAPALAAGNVVLCDRFTDSTRAYQCYGHGLDRQTVERVKEASLGAVEPDMTFILDVPADIGLKRSTRRLAGQEQGASTEDRFERLDIGFHERLRHGYLSLAGEDAGRFTVVDATQSPDEVFHRLKTAIQARLDRQAA